MHLSPRTSWEDKTESQLPGRFCLHVQWAKKHAQSSWSQNSTFINQISFLGLWQWLQRFQRTSMFLPLESDRIGWIHLLSSSAEGRQAVSSWDKWWLPYGWAGRGLKGAHESNAVRKGNSICNGFLWDREWIGFLSLQENQWERLRFPQIQVFPMTSVNLHTPPPCFAP